MNAKRNRCGIIGIALLSGAALAGGGALSATAAEGTASASEIDHHVVPETRTAGQYWTSDRMEAATPADVLIDADAAPTADGVAAGAPVTLAAQVPTAAQVSPVSHIGKVFFTLDGQDFVCSANAVASGNGNTVSTAGHCLNSGPGAFASRFTFVPAYENGSAPYGQWVATDLIAPTAWTQGGDISYDTGFAVVASPTGTSLSDTGGASGVAFNQSRSATYTAYGVPGGVAVHGRDAADLRGHRDRRPVRPVAVAGHPVRHDRRILGRPLVPRLGLLGNPELGEQLRLQPGREHDVRAVLGLQHPGRLRRGGEPVAGTA